MDNRDAATGATARRLVVALLLGATSLVLSTPAAAQDIPGIGPPKVPETSPDQQPIVPDIPEADTPVPEPGAATIQIGSDAELQSRLEAVFAQVDALEGISVSVTEGVVELTGTVPTASARAAAESVAERFDRTLYVDNQLDIVDDAPEPRPGEREQTVRDEAIQNQLAEVFSRVDELRDVEADVQGGVVQLTGETTSPEAYKQAETLAGQIEGVMYVDNDIDVARGVSERLSTALINARRKLREVVGYLPLFAVAFLILAVFWALARLIARFGLSGDRFAEQPFIRNVVRQAIAVVIFLLGVLFVLELFEVTPLVGAVLGTAGVAGLVLGFAFRDIAENYLASILLSLQRPFERHDLIEIDQYRGKVVRLTTRATVLMTLEGNHIQIPNATVYESPIYNYTRNPRRRFSLRVDVDTDEDLVQAQQVGLEMFREARVILDDPEPYATLQELGDSTVVLDFHGWMDQREYDWERVRSEALRRLKRVLEAEGIELPEPTYRVLTAQLAEEREEEEERRKRAARELEQPGMDIEVEPGLDEQIEEDRQHSDEPDLLSS